MGGARKSLTAQTTDWPLWMQPQVQDFGQQIQSYFQGAPQELPQNLYQQLAGFTPYQQQGLTGMAETAQGQQPLAGAGGDLALQTLQGQFLDPSTNPYLQQTYEAAARGLTNQYQTATAPSLAAEALRAGAMGGTGFNQAQALQQYGLGQNLGDLATQIYGGAYEQERGRQMQQEQLLPSLMQAQLMPSQATLQAGTIQQAQQQQAFDTQLQNALRAFQYPTSQLEEYGNLLGQLRGPAGQSITVAPNRAGWLKAALYFLLPTALLLITQVA